MKFIAISMLLFPLLLALIAPVKGDLECVLTPTKLPRGMYSAALAYDGDDIIYLLGGYPREHNEILRYSVSSGMLEVVGSNPAFGSYGIAETDRNGNPIFLCARGENGYKDVVRFNRLENTTELIATHNYSKLYAASVTINADTVLIIGGAGTPNGLLTFDTATYKSTVRADLPGYLAGFTPVRVENAAFVFSNGTVLKIDLETFSSEVISAPGFPYLSSKANAVYDGHNIYSIGPYSSEFSTGGLLRFNPNNYESEFVPVENFPVNGSEYFSYPPESVYVEKMNRIYMFGGHTGRTYYDGIWYIDMSPVNPTTTDLPPDTTTLFPDTFCVNRTNGMYPHPTECDMFLGCWDEVLDIFTCPPPLLFNPEVGTCDDPTQVVCPFSCVDKEDGRYPHEDCSMFYLCSLGQVQVFQCPLPLLFHPVDKVCAYSQVVDCQN